MNTRIEFLIAATGICTTVGVLRNTEAAATLAPRVAPELTIEQTVGVPDGAELSWSALSGKVVILEFWSTQCAPCVGAISHLNDLVEKFAHKPVQFLSITTEDGKSIDRFLLRRPIRGWIGLDPDGSTAAAFGVTRIPCTVIVDAKGRVAGVTSPLEVTAPMIEEVLAGNPVQVSPPDPSDQVPLVGDNARTDEESPLLELVIRTSSQTDERVSRDDTEFRAAGWSLRSAVAFVNGVPESRVLVPASIADRRFDVLARWAAPCDVQPAALIARISDLAFGVSTRTEDGEVDVHVLASPADVASLKIEKNTVSGTTSYVTRHGGVVSSTNGSMDAAAQALECFLGTPVLNETGLRGGYDFELHLDAGTPESICRCVQEELGLTLTKQRRRVTFVVVEPVNTER